MMVFEKICNNKILNDKEDINKFCYIFYIDVRDQGHVKVSMLHDTIHNPDTSVE